jgi:phosphomannomutase
MVTIPPQIEEKLKNIDPQTKNNIISWLSGPYDEKTKKQILKEIDTSIDNLSDSFCKTLDFGTGGIRSIMGVGCNRLNIFTIEMATQGLANYLLKSSSNEKEIRVVVGFDSRHHSKEFADVTAKVLAANGIKAYVFKNLRPTPFISFSCRHLKCLSAVMITASHNPGEYNGYKVYWSDGGQVLPPHDKGIIDEYKKITSPDDVKRVESLENPNITILDDEIDSIYLEKVKDLQLLKENNQKDGKELKILYSNLHGTGITTFPPALKLWGFSDLSFVEKQKPLDGDFTFAHPPNPEVKSTLQMGIDEMLLSNKDLFIATDPDADRMACVINHKNKAQILTGNQIACILLDHICKVLKSEKKLIPSFTCVKSIVTTELLRKIALSYDIDCIDVLTGFKYIAEMINLWENDNSLKNKFLFGAEESYGYLYGDFVRDKDATIAGCLLCEIALNAKKDNKTLVDVLYEIYQKHGIFQEKQLSIKFEDSNKGHQKMKNLMENLRKNPPKTISNCEIIKFEDYLTSIGKDLKNKKDYKIDLPVSNVLMYQLSDDTKIVVRPSGTEPKVKIYVMATAQYCGNILEEFQKLDSEIDALLDNFKMLISS